MTELAERYEDRPDEREEVAIRIAGELDGSRAHTPWPILE